MAQYSATSANTTKNILPNKLKKPENRANIILKTALKIGMPIKIAAIIPAITSTIIN